jgi:hypothetical protein
VDVHKLTFVRADGETKTVAALAMGGYLDGVDQCTPNVSRGSHSSLVAGVAVPLSISRLQVGAPYALNRVGN